MTGAIGDGGQSWEMRSMRGLGLGLEIQDVSSLDIEWGAVRVVDFMGVGGASAVAKVVRNFPKRDFWQHSLHKGGRYFSINKEPAHA